MVYGEGGTKSSDLLLPGLMLMILGWLLVGLTGPYVLNIYRGHLTSSRLRAAWSRFAVRTGKTRETGYVDFDWFRVERGLNF
ncbi:MAG: hypothetical protein QOD28_295 [Acidobacteriota bacterium]|nr:hypothetical protein [Acidobacteriota bacterium]